MSEATYTTSSKMPPFAAFPGVEAPAAFRDMAEKSLSHAKDSYEKMKSAAEEATGVLEDTYASATKGATDYSRKVIELTGKQGGNLSIKGVSGDNIHPSPCAFEAAVPSSK